MPQLAQAVNVGVNVGVVVWVSTGLIVGVSEGVQGPQEVGAAVIVIVLVKV